MPERRSRDGDASGQIGLFKSIAGDLRKSPPYLLVFAVILLNYLYCLALVVRGQATTYLAASMAFMPLVALATIIAVETTTSRSKRSTRHEAEIAAKDHEIQLLRQNLASADSQDINIADREASEHLETTIAHVRSAMAYENDVFRDEIRFRLTKFKEDSETWAQGDLVTSAEDYERILHLFYREARESVFATCNKEYLKFWQSPKSARILKAHEDANRANGALVTRVFVFSTLDDIEEQDLEIVKKHCSRAWITGKIFIFDESPGGPMGGSLFKDFVIIDAGRAHQATGVTNSFEVGSMTAKWMVDSDADTERARKFIKANWSDVEEIEHRLAAAGS